MFHHTKVIVGGKLTKFLHASNKLYYTFYQGRRQKEVMSVSNHISLVFLFKLPSCR